MIRGLLFDINGTLIDIATGETDENIYRTTANFLDFHGVKIAPPVLREEYFSLMRRQKRQSGEKFPEFDVIRLFAEIIRRYGGAATHGALPLAEVTAAVFRAAGRYQLQLYEGVLPVLRMLAERYPMGAVSDGQKVWAMPELRSVGLAEIFFPIIISGDYGFRKPDPRMYRMALRELALRPAEVIFVGNDMYRDVCGAHDAGMKTVFFRSNQGEQNFCGSEPDYIIRRFGELPDAVNFLSAR